MATIVSLDPRVTRMEIDQDPGSAPEPKAELDQFPTFEVFHQERTGAHHVHVGSVHAPNADLALLLAKEQYGRRGQTVNLWVVNTRDVVTMSADDADVFATTPEKNYRDVGAYMVRNKVEAFKKQQGDKQA
ncbi:MAG: 1,2-phenylacetyl-CoA epoxidase subunit [Bacteroidota bacterium]|jgi:ring-1,2-phenylacetyl-CoA epoxidase subunit PaaB